MKTSVHWYWFLASAKKSMPVTLWLFAYIEYGRFYLHNMEKSDISKVLNFCKDCLAVSTEPLASGSQRDVVYIGWPSYMSPTAGSLPKWVHQCTWEPKYDLRFNSIVNLCFRPLFRLVVNNCPCPWRRGERRLCRQARRRGALAPPPSACSLRGQRSSLCSKRRGLEN